MKFSMFRSVSVVVTTAIACVGPLVSAQEKFPSKPIEIIVPTPPGGGTDIAVRILAEAAEPFLGQKLVVSNKPGGAGLIGMASIVKARPDGYTLGGLWNAPLTMTPHVQAAPYGLNDYLPVSLMDSAPIVLCTKKEFPADSGKAFIEHIRANPNKYTYGNDGVGGTIQLATERIFIKFGAKARAVPFGGAGETVKNFLGGHVDIYGGSISTILPHVKEGTAKCLLLTGNKPNPNLPQAATVADIGVPDAVTTLWHGIIAPKGLAADRLSILEQAFQNAARSEKFVKFLEPRGLDLEASSSRDFRNLINAEFTAMGEVIKSIGLGGKP